VVEVQATVSCGGVQVRPGDIVGCDDDGILVVPYEIAADMATHAVAILLADMQGRRELYKKLGISLDETVDVEKVERYFAGLR
jgi:4-hydroxy-4-methyl-2-oxoglutarate aldolase